MSRSYTVIFISLLACASIARGYMVGLPVPLEKLTADSDIVFKGTVVSSGSVQDESFKPYPGFSAHETQFNVISVIKGDETNKTIRFHHYDEDPTTRGVE